MKSLIKIGGVVVLCGVFVFFETKLLFTQETKQIKPTRPPKSQDTTLRLDSESPTAQEAEEVSEQENKSTPVNKDGKTPPLFPGPNAILKAQIHIKTEEDIKSLRDLGLECCADTGICECQVTMKQLMELVGHGLTVIKASTVNTAKLGEETKPKSTEIIPAKPKPREMEEIFILEVNIKTGKEMEVIKKIGMECKFVGEEAFCRATQQQMEELEKEGIDFVVQKEKRKGEK